MPLFLTRAAAAAAPVAASGATALFSRVLEGAGFRMESQEISSTTQDGLHTCTQLWITARFDWVEMQVLTWQLSWSEVQPPGSSTSPLGGA